MSEVPLKPMIRWAGSKRKLLPLLLRYAPAHTRYVEPFAGSACLFFALSPKSALLGDMNDELMQSYIAVRDMPSDVHAKLRKMPVTADYYYKLRAMDLTNAHPAERSARFLYLNRFCFNGVYRTNRQGHFNVPRGVRTGSLPTKEELNCWSERLQRASFYVGDFEGCISDVGAGDFVYLDPPYSKSGVRNRGEYGYSAFSAVDLPRLRACIQEISDRGATFLLSYRYSRDITNAFPDWHRRTLNVRRHVSGFVAARANVKEVLFSNRPFIERKK
jgi:DNA adenine methylase